MCKFFLFFNIQQWASLRSEPKTLSDILTTSCDVIGIGNHYASQIGPFGNVELCPVYLNTGNY